MPYRQFSQTANCEGGSYAAGHSLNVMVSPADVAGNLASFAYEIGATDVRISGFTSEDDSELSRLAMSQAVQDARDNAQLIAEASGLELGQLLTLRPNRRLGEMGAQYRRALNPDEVLRDEQRLSGRQSLDIAPDQVRRSVQIEVIFELVDPAPASDD